MPCSSRAFANRGGDLQVNTASAVVSSPPISPLCTSVCCALAGSHCFSHRRCCCDDRATLAYPCKPLTRVSSVWSSSCTVSQERGIRALLDRDQRNILRKPPVPSVIERVKSLRLCLLASCPSPKGSNCVSCSPCPETTSGLLVDLRSTCRWNW